ncbi:hypothetical protein CR513_05235, partial [Mucuna pruriens]
MTILALKLQLHTFIRSMYDEGYINEKFLNLQGLRQPLRRDSVVRAVASYYLSCKNLFSSLTHHIDQQKVDFKKVNELARDLYTRSSR